MGDLDAGFCLVSVLAPRSARTDKSDLAQPGEDIGIGGVLGHAIECECWPPLVQPEDDLMPSAILKIILVIALFCLASWERWAVVEQASALGDAVHPWWSAIRTGWPRVHAPPYGWGIVIPYKACLIGVAGVIEAVQRLALVHALAAPLTAVACWRISGRVVPGLVVGVIVAMDPGLIDTFQSGAEGYLASVWLGVAVLGLTLRESARAPVMMVALSMALMNHPMAVAALPLVAAVRWRGKAFWMGAAAAILLLAPRIVRLFLEPIPSSGGGVQPMEALAAFVLQGGAVAVVILMGPVIGLISPRSRRLAILCLASMILMAALGTAGGYLRDHHIRILTIPALLGWAAVPIPLAAVVALSIVLPRAVPVPASLAERPGTLGLNAHLSSVVRAELSAPLVVDEAWLHGGPAGSAAGVMLDLHLSGWDAGSLRPGKRVAVIVSGPTQAELDGVPPRSVLVRTEQYALVAGSVDEVMGWSAAWCGGRLGGAWDAVSVLHPGIQSSELRGWWACP